jgi:uncharacterized protein YndB with AHSA1/START domain
MARQTSIIASAVIPASPERVWQIAGDTSRYPEWVEGTLRMIHTNGPTRVGATYEELTRIAGPCKSVTRWRVTEWDPPRRQVHQGEGISTSKDTAVIIELSPAGQDTNFTLTVATCHDSGQSARSSTASSEIPSPAPSSDRRRRSPRS